MDKKINNTDDIIYSQAIDARVIELQNTNGLSEEDSLELTVLQELVENCKQYYRYWDIGTILINRNFFKIYQDSFGGDKINIRDYASVSVNGAEYLIKIYEY